MARLDHLLRTALAGTVLWLTVAGAMAQGAEAVIPVLLDRAKILKMPPNAQTIVVGNPIIADVTTLKNNGLVVVTGKGFGETNLIFLDGSGAAVQEATIRVEAPGSQLLVQSGMKRQSYSCQPRCEPTVSLGDDSEFLKDASSQITSRNQLATPGGGAH